MRILESVVGPLVGPLELLIVTFLLLVLVTYAYAPAHDLVRVVFTFSDGTSRPQPTDELRQLAKALAATIGAIADHLGHGNRRNLIGLGLFALVAAFIWPWALLVELDIQQQFWASVLTAIRDLGPLGEMSSGDITADGLVALTVLEGLTIEGLIGAVTLPLLDANRDEAARRRVRVGVTVVAVLAGVVLLVVTANIAEAVYEALGQQAWAEQVSQQMNATGQSFAQVAHGDLDQMAFVERWDANDSARFVYVGRAELALVLNALFAGVLYTVGGLIVLGAVGSAWIVTCLAAWMLGWWAATVESGLKLAHRVGRFALVSLGLPAPKDESDFRYPTIQIAHVNGRSSRDAALAGRLDLPADR